MIFNGVPLLGSFKKATVATEVVTALISNQIDNICNALIHSRLTSSLIMPKWTRSKDLILYYYYLYLSVASLVYSLFQSHIGLSVLKSKGSLNAAMIQ